jgi:hypothetical protein
MIHIGDRSGIANGGDNLVSVRCQFGDGVSRNADVLGEVLAGQANEAAIEMPTRSVAERPSGPMWLV